MGLFTQEIKVGLKNSNNIVEKIQIDNIKKGRIKLFVRPGSNCVIPTLGYTEYLGQTNPYVLEREMFVQTKGDSCDLFVYADKEVSIPIPFFAGQYNLPIPGAHGLRGTYALVGTAFVRVSDYSKICMRYGESVTEEQIIEDVKNNHRKALADEMSTFAKKFIKDGIGEIELSAALDKIIEAMIEDGGKSSSVFRELGLRISSKKTTLHLNPLDDVEEIQKKIASKDLDVTMYELDSSKRKDQADLLAAARQFEIDAIKASNTTIRETTSNSNSNSSLHSNETTNINANGGAKNITINQQNQQNDISFCPSCGQKIGFKNATFCPKCGRKLK